MGNVWATGVLDELARAVIAQVGKGEVTRDAMFELADAVLADAGDAVRLALEVREGCKHAVRCALELAAIVVGASSARGTSRVD